MILKCVQIGSDVCVCVWLSATEMCISVHPPLDHSPWRHGMGKIFRVVAMWYEPCEAEHTYKR